MTKNDKNDQKWPDVKNGVKNHEMKLHKNMNYYVINDMIYAWPNSIFTFEEDWNLGNSQNSSTFEKFLIIKKILSDYLRYLGNFTDSTFFKKFPISKKDWITGKFPKCLGIWFGKFP